MNEYVILMVNGLTALIFILAGSILYYNPPKSINHLYGYRTPQSMSSQQKWDFSQSYSGKLMVIFGCLMVLLALTDIWVSYDSFWTSCLAIAPTLLVCILLLLITETKMKKIE